MAGRFSSYLSTPWMDMVETIPKWLSVVSADPFATGNPYTAEIIAPTLTRRLSTWTRTGPGILTLTGAIDFAGLLPGAHVAGVAGWDAEVNGNLLFSDMLDAPVDFPSGGIYVLAANEYIVGIDVPGA